MDKMEKHAYISEPEPDAIRDALGELRDLRCVGDEEVCHCEADMVLIRYLRRTGAGEIADQWEELRETIGFWYA